MNAQSRAPVLRLRAASLTFAGLGRTPVQALSQVSLQVHSGERLALVGANGCGKSTLLRVMHGLLQVTTGEVWATPQLRQAMLFQRPHMLRTSALAHVALGLKLQGMRGAQAHARAMAALERVGLGAYAGQAAYTLSGGQQQRLALARAWALQPDILFLDEPTASLDPYAKHEVEALMAAFARPPEGGPDLTMVFASHNLGQVKRLADRVVYLEHGRVLADLPVAEFFDPQRLAAVAPEALIFVKGELV